MSSNNPVIAFSKHRIWMTSALIVVAAVIAVSFSMFGSEKSVEYFTQPVERGSIAKVVNATGTVQPVVTVQVGSQVSGQIQTLYADYNSVVKRGQLLAKIDPRNFQAQLADAQANLAAAKAREQSAKADLGTMQANLTSAEANLNSAGVTRDNDAQNYKRYQEMSHTGIVAENDYDNVRTTSETSSAKYEQARAAVDQAKAQITAQQAQIQQTEAQVHQAEADLDAKRVNLEYANIFSPVDGVVISRNVDVGQTVAAGLQAPLLFVIANDLTHMQVNASVDEADIGLITSDVEVRFTVDAFPNRTFSGKIQEIRLDPQTAQNVVTYNVIIGVDNRNLYLKPGMTANITMTIDKRENVLKIPNAALRYQPQNKTEAEEASVTPFQETTTGPDTVSGHVLNQENIGTSEGQDKAANRQNLVASAKNSPQAKIPRAAALPESSGNDTTEQAPGQLWNPSDKLRFPPASPPAPKPGRVWTLDSRNNPVESPLELGITDGVFTEALSGNIHNGESLIVADSSQETSDSTQRAGSRGPFGRFGRR